MGCGYMSNIWLSVCVCCDGRVLARGGPKHVIGGGSRVAQACDRGWI